MIGTDELPLSQHDVLDPDECMAIAERVLALRNRWTTRSSDSFYTLGAASYLDATENHDAYIEAALESNPILQENFDAALSQLRDFFEGFFGDPVFMIPIMLCPGSTSLS